VDGVVEGIQEPGGEGHLAVGEDAKNMQIAVGGKPETFHARRNDTYVCIRRCQRECGDKTSDDGKEDVIGCRKARDICVVCWCGCMYGGERLTCGCG